MDIGQIRQGDVLLVPVEGAVPPYDAAARREVVLAQGEITGHAHRLRGVEVYEWEADGQRYVRVASGVGTLSHEDHDPIPAPVVPSGVTYQVVPQREWDLSGEWRRVLD